jgi:hypothetical protein
VGREYGISKHTIYGWKAKYGGMDVTGAQEAKQLQDENTRLRKLVANLESLQGSAAVGDSKKRMELVAMKAAVEPVEQQYAFSQRRACSLLMVAVSSVRYQARSSDEDHRAENGGRSRLQAGTRCRQSPVSLGFERQIYTYLLSREYGDSPGFSVFTRRAGVIRHFSSGEMSLKAA